MQLLNELVELAKKAKFGHYDSQEFIAAANPAAILAIAEYVKGLENHIADAGKMMGWVKCSERMPLEYLGESEVFRSVEVIVTDGITVGTCECQAGNGPKPWVAFSSYGDVKGTDITHWMPLPSPPTE